MNIECQTCHAHVPGYDMIHFGSFDTGYRDLCSRCFNEEVADTRQLSFEHVAFEPIVLSDAIGKQHRFHFTLRHLGDRIVLDAFEVHDGERGGYEFQVVDDADVDFFKMMARLVARMQRALALQHLIEGDDGLQIANMTVRARVSSDPESDYRTPVLTIDGREVKWDEFGKMLLSFEGWQIKLDIKDPSDEF